MADGNNTRIQVRHWNYDMPFKINLFQDGIVSGTTLDCVVGKPAPEVNVVSTDYWVEGWYLDAEFSNPIDLTQPMPYMGG